MQNLCNIHKKAFCVECSLYGYLSSVVNHKVVDLVTILQTVDGYICKLEDSQQHFDRTCTVQAPSSSVCVHPKSVMPWSFFHKKSHFVFEFCFLSRLGISPQCVNIRYPYKERSTPSISKILQNPVCKTLYQPMFVQMKLVVILLCPLLRKI